ncbi:hypothetical protein GYMLUDRAFT_245928 [Collybiopsis luxurians FD-317 M1]|uniref:Uncharacterized protein n=1 Tax=Collybiopsis luxurians FD-317 M1 TaxID=944289 RepID=A0A0D0CS93_9AGAR|nr:hypothetical protein GYMLUDRAFT_245928 [Collybiopsis luxurians FD-317 M1]
MEFSLNEVDELHDTVQEPLIELTVGAVDWFKDIEATYYSDESDEWKTQDGDELTDSEKEEEESDSKSLLDLQDVSDSDSKYGYKSDSNDLDESSTPCLVDKQNLTHQVPAYPSYFNSSELSLTNDCSVASYPTSFDSKPFTLYPNTVKVVEDLFEWLFHSPKWDDRTSKHIK